MTHTLSPQRLEKAAEALRQLEQGGKKLNAWDTLPKATKKKWCDKASVVVSGYLGDTHVDVPREPTEAMIDAAFKSGFEGDEGHIMQDYRAMLSAELKERDAG